MYIIKNALRCITRSKGRNILIGIIVLVISVSACIGLSIRQAALRARESTLEGMTITATISYDRSSAMGGMGGKGQGGKFDRDQFVNMMGGITSLSLEEYTRYADAHSVKDFYYTLTAYFNGSDTCLPVSTEASDSKDGDETLNGTLESEESGKKPFMGGGMMVGMSKGDFTVIGYSSDAAMTEFIDGGASILEGGEIFKEGTDEYVCIISEELAIYNDLSVGDTVSITNPTLESECYELKISGIYKSASSNDFFASRFGMGQDPANRIYTSANTLQAITDASAASASDTAVTATVQGTYTFASTEDYYAFEGEARALGLGDSYTVSSSDVTTFENSLTPLETLSTMAGWFLIVILIIGGIILVVLNIFNVRERKYEVGVLTAMGMKKWKVAVQFMCEILVVTMIAVVLGAAIGAVSALPVTNTLLSSQVETQSNQKAQIETNFGRPGGMGAPGGNMGSGMPGEMPKPPEDRDNGKNNMLDRFKEDATNYITEVDSAMNLTVVAQMIAIGLLLTVMASAASVLFIMRYDPLRILSNRD